MRFFLIYLRQRMRVIGTFALFSVIFAGTFALYKLPVEAVAYPVLLCLLLALGMSAVDFRRICRRHAQLQRVERLSAELIDALPGRRLSRKRTTRGLFARCAMAIANLKTI